MLGLAEPELVPPAPPQEPSEQPEVPQSETGACFGCWGGQSVPGGHWPAFCVLIVGAGLQQLPEAPVLMIFIL